ncbi:MAG: hypothetical protein KDD70_00070 [Bdellovibrionales bacterium]|nr:hypothetical protein [Bdellovibrionales bacterium]
MREARNQATKTLATETEDLVGQAFDAASKKFISELRALHPDAAEKVAEVLKPIRAEFTPAAAREIIELIETGDEESLRSASEQLQKLRSVLELGGAAVETEVTAEKILKGFKKLEGGVIEITLPVGTTIQQAGELLNAAAKEKNMTSPVFNERYETFWAKYEKNPSLETHPGRTYRFKIATDSASNTRSEKGQDHDGAVPLGAIAIAEACERLNTRNTGTLLKVTASRTFVVRGSDLDVALTSSPGRGVSVCKHFRVLEMPVALASSVPSSASPD